jgi:hypothetical protein
MVTTQRSRDICVTRPIGTDASTVWSYSLADGFPPTLTFLHAISRLFTSVPKPSSTSLSSCTDSTQYALLSSGVWTLQTSANPSNLSEISHRVASGVKRVHIYMPATVVWCTPPGDTAYPPR